MLSSAITTNKYIIPLIKINSEAIVDKNVKSFFLFESEGLIFFKSLYESLKKIYKLLLIQ